MKQKLPHLQQLLLNDNVFAGFEAPKNLQQAYEIMLHFNVNAWLTGNRGISISMKNGK